MFICLLRCMPTRGPVGQTRCNPPNDDGPQQKRDERSKSHEDRTPHNVNHMVEANTHPSPINDDCKQRKGQCHRNIDKTHQHDERRSQEGVIRGEPVVSSMRNERPAGSASRSGCGQKCIDLGRVTITLNSLRSRYEY